MSQFAKQQDTNLIDLVKSISLHLSGSGKFDKFKRLYSNDRVAFAYDMLPDYHPTFYQANILSKFDEGHNRVAVKSPHGTGKTFLAAILTHHSVLTAESDCKVPTTASAWRQLEKYLWPEIKKLAKNLAWPRVGRPPYDQRSELLTTSIKLSNGLIEAFALASDDHTLIEGAHATRLMYVFDEAKSIYVSTWDAAEGAFSSEDMDDADIKAFAISTPGDPSGRFYDIHARKPGYEDWLAIHISLEDAIRAGRVSAKWAARRLVQWGEDSSMYQNRVLGEFADNSDDGIIPRSWVRLSNERYNKWLANGRPRPIGGRSLGVDMARMGRDSTVVADREAWVLTGIHTFSKLPVTSTAGRIANIARSAQGGKLLQRPDGDSPSNGSSTTSISLPGKPTRSRTSGKNPLINIEMEGGLGASVYDILREGSPDLRLKPINVSGKTYFRDKTGELSFRNVRAAMWWNMRDLLNPEYGFDVALPADPNLELDLITPKWDTMSDGTIKLEAKREIMKRLGRSPDWGTACCLAYWNPSFGGGVVF